MKSINTYFNWTTFQEHRVLVSISILLLFSLLYKFLIRSITPHVGDGVRVRYLWREAITYSMFVVGFVFVLALWIGNLNNIVTFFSLIGVGLTIALKELILNFVCWFIIIWRNLFHLGDRIEIDGNCGDVIDMGIFYFTILEVGNWIDADQSTGRVIKIPNMLVLTSSVANYSRGINHIWVEIPVKITPDSDWQLAKEFLNNLADKYSKKLTAKEKEEINKNNDQIMSFRKLTPTIYTSFKSGAVLLTMRILSEPRKRREAEHAIWEEILIEFKGKNNINFA